LRPGGRPARAFSALRISPNEQASRYTLVLLCTIVAASGDAPPIERIMVKQRPVYLNLVRIRLPLPGIVSILHRISGAALFLFAIPVVLFAMQASVESEDGFASLRSMLANPLCKLILIGLLWAYLHHFFAGIR